MNARKRNPEIITEAIRAAKTIAVCSHVSPDGDTLGSAAAMRLALLSLGKDVTVFCQDKVPDNLAFLPGADMFRAPEETDGPFDLMLSVDVSDAKRLGTCERLRKVSRHTAQIDHHSNNPMFMDDNSVDEDAAATCVMIREQLRSLGVPLTREIAICLYTGISTDTGNFSFSCTTGECFEVMSELMQCGLPLPSLNRVLFRERAMPQVKLIGRALSSLKYYEDGKLAVMTLTLKDFEECGATGEHADTIVNFGLDTAGTCYAILARETEGKTVKFSLRAKEPGTVNDVAALFGGGGHQQAAGINMQGDLYETVDAVRDALIRKMNG